MSVYKATPNPKPPPKSSGMWVEQDANSKVGDNQKCTVEPPWVDEVAFNWGSISCSKRKLTSWGWFKWNWPEQIARCKSKKWTAKIEDQFVRHKEFPHCKQINSDCWIYSTQSASNVRLQHIPTKPSTSQRQDSAKIRLSSALTMIFCWKRAGPW